MMQIRRAQKADAQGIHIAHMDSIRENCSKDYTPEQISAWAGRKYREDLRQSAIENDLVWVLKQNHIIQGYAHLKSLHPEKTHQGEVMALYLRKEATGKGYGRSLMSLMEKEAREMGLSSLILDSTLSAVDFYTACGFKSAGIFTTVEINGANIECLPMKKVL